MHWNQIDEPADLAELWPDAEYISLLTLGDLLDAANEVCVAYAPPLPITGVIPERYLLAELMQAKHIWSAMRGGNSESMGPEGLAIPAYPLVFQARDLLRPKTSPLLRLR